MAQVSDDAWATCLNVACFIRVAIFMIAYNMEALIINFSTLITKQ